MQMMLLRISGAAARETLQAMRSQGFLREPPVVQLKALQMAGFSLVDLAPVASFLAPTLGAVVRTLEAFGAPALHFGPNELEHLCAAPEEPGFSVVDRLRFFMQAFPERERLVLNLAARLCNSRPSRELAALVRDYGVDPHSLLLRARSVVQARLFREALGLPRWRSLGVPEWPWLPDTLPTFRKRRVPKGPLALLAPGDLAFVACSFEATAPPIQAETLHIRSCPTLRRLGALDVENLVLIQNARLENLPEGLHLRGSLRVQACPRLQVPPGLVVEGDLLLEGHAPDLRLPRDLSVGGRILFRPQTAQGGPVA